MAATAQATKNQITLKGSVATVTEFFQHALSSILYQRGIYAPESFEPKKAYGLTVMAVKDDKLTAYLQAVLQQFSSECPPQKGRVELYRLLLLLVLAGSP